MTAIIQAIRGEFVRYKDLGERSIAQLSDTELSVGGPGGGNSVAVICWHIAGNFQSRFTEFLTTDGEKPWRNREEEFNGRKVTRTELLAKWDQGWTVALDALANLTDQQLHQTVTIRHQPLEVHEALLRSLAHLSHHVGQIVYLAHLLRGKEWKYLSIPPGGSDAFNQKMSEKGKKS